METKVKGDGDPILTLAAWRYGFALEAYVLEYLPNALKSKGFIVTGDQSLNETQKAAQQYFKPRASSSPEMQAYVKKVEK